MALLLGCSILAVPVIVGVAYKGLRSPSAARIVGLLLCMYAATLTVAAWQQWDRKQYIEDAFNAGLFEVALAETSFWGELWSTLIVGAILLATAVAGYGVAKRVTWALPVLVPLALLSTGVVVLLGIGGLPRSF